MKVLLVAPYPPARDGIATYAAQVAADLRRRGDRVEAVSPEPSAARHHADPRTLRGLVRLLALSRKADRTLVHFYPEMFFSSMRRTRFLRHWPWVALTFALGRDVEVVVHEAPYQALRQTQGLRGKVARALWRAMVTLPRATLVHTEWERRELAGSLGLPTDRIQLLEHSTSFVKRTAVDRAAARLELGLENDEFCFLCIGFLQHHKGFDRAVRAFAGIPGERLRLDIVGSARVPAPEITAYVADLRALVQSTPRAHLHEGYVSDHAFDCWLAACDVVVLPYRDIWSSGVLARAQLFGRCVIVSDVGGLPDQVGPGGRVVHDDAELHRAMAETAGVELAARPSPAAVIEVDEVASQEELLALVRESANHRRHLYEPGSPGPAATPADPWPQFSLPDPSLGGGLRAAVKRSIAQLTRWQLAPLVRQLNELQVHLGKMSADGVDRRLSQQEVRLDELRASLEGAKHAFDVQMDDVRGGISWLRHLRGEDRAELTSELARLRATTSGAGADHVEGADRAGQQRTSAADAEQPAYLAAFYEAHQERFRGSRENVRHRLETYLPHVQAVASPAHPVLDIGPGRGEWLALLRERRIQAYGVDVNAAFVAAGVKMGIDVRHQDAIEHLKQLPDGSLSAITAFHVVEHIPLPALIDLVDHALRALRHGGLLILETPNPLNVMVGAAWFHMDPTHIKPLPPLFLEFVLENRGFTDVRVLMANPPEEPPLTIPAAADGSTATVARMAELINRAFFVGMDFAVLGRRANPAEERAGR